MGRTRVDTRDDPAYWTALGCFIHRFATVEAVMFHFLAFYVGVPVPIAKAVFSGIRIDAAVDFIRRVVKVKDPGADRAAELESFLTQLKAINDLRNSIVHQGSFETDDAGRITSNIVRALTADRIVERPASITIIEAAASERAVPSSKNSRRTAMWDSPSFC